MYIFIYEDTCMFIYVMAVHVTSRKAPHVERRTAFDVVLLATALAFATYVYVANKSTLVSFLWRGFTETGPEHVRVSSFMR
jgi:hypothetical protein